MKWVYNKKIKSIKKHSVKRCAINKISQLSSVKIWNKIQNLLHFLKLIQGGIEKIRSMHTVLITFYNGNVFLALLYNIGGRFK